VTSQFFQASTLAARSCCHF